MKKKIIITKKEIEQWLDGKKEKAYDKWAGTANIAYAINNKPLTPKQAKECNPELFYYSIFRQMLRDHGPKQFIFPW